MTLEWTFNAEAYFDQLSPEEQGKVLHAVESLSTDWERLVGTSLKRLADADELYALRVGADLRVLARRRGAVVTIVDVVRRSQVEGLRRVVAPGQAMVG